MPRTADRPAAESDAATFAAIDRIIGEFDAARAARRKKKPRAAPPSDPGPGRFPGPPSGRLPTPSRPGH